MNKEHEDLGPVTWAHVLDERRTYIQSTTDRRNKLELKCVDLADEIQVKAKQGMKAKELRQKQAHIAFLEEEIIALNELLFVYRDASAFIPGEGDE